MQQVELDKVPMQLAQLIERALQGEEVIITQADRPILKLVRVTPDKPRRQRGSAKGLIKIADDFDAPLADFQTYMSSSCSLISIRFYGSLATIHS